MIIAENVFQSFGAQEVFRNVSFRLSPTDRVGLVGPNGEGKTTLLRIMGGMMEPTGGVVHRSRGLRLGYLPQVPPPMEEGTVYQAMLRVFAGVRQMEEDLSVLATRLSGAAAGDAELLRQYGAIQSRFEVLGGLGYTTRIEQVLTGLAFDRSMWDQPVATLSGGQRTRAALATLLLRDPRLLMLDEPTNHLDLDSVEWLEVYLRSFTGALVIVSHDRYFLDRATQDTWEVSRGCIECYHGPYSAYLTQRAERRKERLRAWEAQQEYVAKTEEFIARHLAGQRTKEAQGRRTRLERFLRDSAIERPTEDREMTLRLSTDQRTGDLVLRATGLAAGYDRAKPPLVDAPELEIRRGQKIAVVGANGAGKTTLLRTLLGELPPLAGQVRHGSRVDIGYLSQAHSELEPQSTVLEAVMSADRQCKEQEARTLLGSLQLSGDDVFKRLGDLSGGERSRVVLARLVLCNANVLMLDEPTNHLDIPSREIIQSVLQEFEGTVLFVSHDRYLIEAVATDVWVVDGGAVHVVPGGWERFLLWRTARRGAASAVTPGPAEAADRDSRRAEPRTTRKPSNRERQLKEHHQKIEQEIEAAEAELVSLMEQVSAAGQAADMARVEELSRTYQQRDTHLKELWAEWERLGEQLA